MEVDGEVPDIDGRANLTRPEVLAFSGGPLWLESAWVSSGLWTYLSCSMRASYMPPARRVAGQNRKTVVCGDVKRRIEG